MKNKATLLDKVALTISPPDDIKLDVKQLLKIHFKKIAKIKSNIMLYPELSTTGRLHYHGIMERTIHVKEDLLQLEKVGFICVKAISDLKGWLKYCRKEWRHTRKLLHRADKPYNLEEIKGFAVSESEDITKYFTLQRIISNI